jgi:hypothetical protein
MAGTGKTAIASTFATNMEEQGILGATFFIDRQQVERRDLSRIVQTLAYDLAKNNYRQLEAVWTVLRENPTFERLPFEKQARLIIKEPLDIARPNTIVIVIDGLDECGASNGALLLATLVSSLAHHPIKLFVTSRNEVEIVDTLRALPHTSYKLQDVEVSGDMRLYWAHKLDELCRRRRLPDWRSTVSLKELVELTGHLLIYATTLLKIIQDTRTSPISELVRLLEISRAGSGSSMVFAGEAVHHSPLEKLYINILGEAIKDDDGRTSTEYALRLHDILEAVIFGWEPLTPHALSNLLDMDRDDLDAYLHPLHSVLMVPDSSSPDGVVRPLHRSFPDFISQQGGLVHPHLIMDVTVACKHMAERCFGQLNKHLHLNICNIEDASLFNREVSDLPTRLNVYVSRALCYSCRHWLSHFLQYIRAAGSQAQVPLGLATFCEQHLLHWIEVLSLTEDMNAVQQVMPDLILVMNVCLSHS